MNPSKSLLAYLLVKQANPLGSVAKGVSQVGAGLNLGQAAGNMIRSWAPGGSGPVFSKQKGQTPTPAVPTTKVPATSNPFNKPGTGVNAPTIPGTASQSPGWTSERMTPGYKPHAALPRPKDPRVNEWSIDPNVSTKDLSALATMGRNNINYGEQGSTFHANGLNRPATGSSYHQLDGQGNRTGSQVISNYGGGSATYGPNNRTGYGFDSKGRMPSVTDGGKPWKPPGNTESGTQFAQRMANNAPSVIPPAAGAPAADPFASVPKPAQKTQAQLTAEMDKLFS